MTSKTAQKQRRGRPFSQGTSGNPAGRPRGSRNLSSLLSEALSDEDGTAIVRTVIQRAKRGNMVAARIILDRTWPAAKGRLVVFPLPPAHDASSVLKAHAAVLPAISAGVLTIDEGAAISQALTLHLKMIETADLEARMQQVEQQLAVSGARDR
ncbi:DUF5681 domain-containing protein [Bradyrhizobium vignae]|uniref:DUF5681 domain-containing protein n=1 Tax=Bradyrhizobium vignae TaxID=1549949 RepID=A0ABS3ZSD9_9BRAD|nr:DUF5681 domain-containing protein [Bradyrhizobium vignae]MBP0111069.1 hypothetical protein [Bradyrhizobium vignae]